MQKSGAGGTFTIDASTASGEKITGKIQCGRFGSIHAEGMQPRTAHRLST